MRGGLTRMLPAAAFVVSLTACSDGSASAQAANAAAPVAAAETGAPIHRIRGAADPYPRNGFCQDSACSWFETREQRIVASSQYERMVRVALVTGRSEHPHGRLPDDAAQAAIAWSADEEQAYVFCSRYRPSVIRRRGSGAWEAVRVDLARGMGDYGESRRAIFGLVCHLGDDWGAGDFFERHDYRPAMGGAVTTVSHPEGMALIHPNDPDRPDQGGMAMASSPPAEAVAVRMPVPAPTSAIDARPMKDRAGHFELFQGEVGETLRTIAGPFATAAECEHARAGRPEREWAHTYCLAGERRR